MALVALEGHRTMKPKRPRDKRKKPRTVLRLPDLEHAKTAVLNSLAFSPHLACSVPILLQVFAG